MIDFEKLIDSHLKRELKPKEIGRYYPSEIGNCLRRVWFTYRKPKEPDKEKLKIFQVGLMFHDFIAEVLRSEKTPEVRLIQSEVPFKLNFPDFQISGRVDDVLLVERNGEKLLVEVKSTKLLSVVKEPSPSHVMQIQLYMHALRIRNGMIVYVEKSSLQTKQYEVRYDPEYVKGVLERFRKLHESLRNGKIPEPEAKLSKDTEWMCRYCEYTEECEKA